MLPYLLDVIERKENCSLVVQHNGSHLTILLERLHCVPWSVETNRTRLVHCFVDILKRSVKTRVMPRLMRKNFRLHIQFTCTFTLANSAQPTEARRPAALTNQLSTFVRRVLPWVLLIHNCEIIIVECPSLARFSLAFWVFYHPVWLGRREILPLQQNLFERSERCSQTRQRCSKCELRRTPPKPTRTVLSKFANPQTVPVIVFTQEGRIFFL